MIEELYIKDFALIKELRLKLGKNLNLITGETGAGKSIILGALNLVLGSKATTDLIRTGAERSIVQATFELTPKDEKTGIIQIFEEHGIECEDGFLYLKREIRTDGKGRSFINSEQVALSLLKKIGSHLVEIHGQNEHQQILKVPTHLHILDRYAGLKADTGKMIKLHRKLVELRQKLKSVALNEKEKNRRIEILTHEIDEIESARLKDEKELEELQSDEKALSHAEIILQNINETHQFLSQTEDSVMNQLSRIKNSLETITEFDSKLVQISSPLQDAFYLLEDVNANLREYKDSISLDPEQLEGIRGRLDQIQTLQEKYGDSIAEILDYLSKTKMEYEGIQISQEEEQRIMKEIQAIQEEMSKLAGRLSNIRRSASKQLEEKVCNELKDLGMQDVELKISVRWDYGEEGLYIHPEQKDKKYIIHPTGLDVVEFLISTSKESQLKPLRKIVSGGEMSRIMLSLKKIIVDSSPVSTMVFDEVDTGVGGRVAEAVGKKLSSLSRSSQVIVITHLHQIAALPGELGKDSVSHFKVSKDSMAGTSIKRLESSQRIEEIARMIGGKTIDESAREHARNLLTVK